MSLASLFTGEGLWHTRCPFLFAFFSPHPGVNEFFLTWFSLHLHLTPQPPRTCKTISSTTFSLATSLPEASTLLSSGHSPRNPCTTINWDFPLLTALGFPVPFLGVLSPEFRVPHGSLFFDRPLCLARAYPTVVSSS